MINKLEGLLLRICISKRSPTQTYQMSYSLIWTLKLTQEMEQRPSTMTQVILLRKTLNSSHMLKHGCSNLKTTQTVKCMDRESGIPHTATFEQKNIRPELVQLSVL